MRLWIRCDWTAAPPGELTMIATAGAALMAKALASSGSTLASDRLGRSPGPVPIEPDSRTTGTTGPPRENSLFTENAMPGPYAPESPSLSPLDGAPRPPCQARTTEASALPSRSIASTGGVKPLPVSPWRTSAGRMRNGPPPPFSPRTSTRVAGSPARGWIGRMSSVPKRRPIAVSRWASPSARKIDRDVAAELQHRGRRAEPRIEPAGVEDMGLGPRRLRRAAAGGLEVEGRVEQDMVGEVAAHAGGGPLRLRRGDIRRGDPHPLGEGGVGGSGQRLPGACNRVGISLDQHYLGVWTARRGAKSGDPDAGAEVGDRAGDACIKRHGEKHRLKARPMVSAGVLQGFHPAAQE